MKFALFSFLGFLLSACSDITYGRELEGRVVMTSSRFGKTGNGETQEKVAVLLDPTGQVDPVIQQTAGGASGLMIECISTRCALMAPGSCAQFKCSFEWASGADVIECKHVREIPCPDAAPLRVIDQGLPGTNGF